MHARKAAVPETHGRPNPNQVRIRDVREDALRVGHECVGWRWGALLPQVRHIGVIPAHEFGAGLQVGLCGKTEPVKQFVQGDRYEVDAPRRRPGIDSVVPSATLRAVRRSQIDVKVATTSGPGAPDRLPRASSRRPRKSTLRHAALQESRERRHGARSSEHRAGRGAASASNRTSI